MKPLFKFFSVLILSVSAVVAAESNPDDVDYLALASIMLRDGNLDRAIIALDQVDLTAEDANPVRYYTLRGMTHLRRSELELSREALQAAIETGEAEAVVFVYLAQVNYRLEDYRGTLEALDRAGATVERIP